VTRLWIMLMIAAVLAGAVPAAAQQQPAPAPVDQGNGNWDPPPVTKPTTQRDGPRVEAVRFALSIRSLAGLAQVQEPRRAGPSSTNL